ncbi:multicopper oxidase family protein [Pseudanabaena sp. FACHB-2040]|uniref:multicopper oxidase family protein n=1 Tax=Pseudanabaena sp. FACHB-2040 TaxID=2692859 RepID=UPI00168235B2|nr:multicopper oxidase family protein [Pseudanabaena sp. FACHB-2040]MBD2256186.1 multicopper oxidase family protein [Pseudanabaena sp. FACHB-2040]
MDRRRFLTLSTAVTGAMLLSQCSIPSQRPNRLLKSQSGQLSIDLAASPTAVNLVGMRSHLLAYNQQVPGPQLEVRPGDTVEIRFTNQLDTPSNLHFHGLHLPPTGEADNPLRMVAPGETALYRFTIPADHRAGTFWYHPHHHGNVASQVAGGLAGLLVVRGDLDEIPEIQAAQEAFLVLQDFDLNWRGQLQEPMPMFRMWGREGNHISINGQAPPTLPLPQSGLLRLRLLNASPSRVYRLQLKKHPWHLIATDGGALGEPVETDEVVLAPGERAELLVPGTREPGTYEIVNLPYDRGTMDMMSGRMGHGMMGSGRMAHSSAQAEPIQVARLTYQAGAAAVPLPKALILVESLPEPEISREFVLDHGIDAQTGQPFLINGQAFDHSRVDAQAKLGSVEDWWIINKAGLDHPFHLHTNSFQVISRDRKPEPYRAWRDVVNVRAYEVVQIRVPFRDFAGKTVFHCHVLDHEDQGMMGIVEIAA